MRYIAWSDVVARYPNVAKLLSAEETVSESNYIAGAEGEIDAALAARYTTPVANTPTLCPPLVRDIAIDIVYYKTSILSMDKEQAQRFKDYINERLLGLASGSLTMVMSGSVVQPLGRGAWGTAMSYPNISGNDCVEDWSVSSGEQGDMAAGRGLY